MARSALNTNAESNPAGLMGKLQIIFNLFLVAVLGYWLSSFVWMFVASDTIPDSPPAFDQRNSAKSKPVISYGKKIADKNLFGIANAPPPKEDEELSRSNLNLKLIGVLAHNPSENKSFAILSSGSRDEVVYGIGDKIPGNATLEEVFPRYVVILRQGRREKIELPDDVGVRLDVKIPQKPSSSAPRRAEVETFQSISPQRASELREEFLTNPGQVMKMVNIQQERQNGRVVGYKLSHRGDPSLFYELGLQDGDVVTAVNGIPISNQGELSSLAYSDRYDVTVLRGGSEMALSLSFE